MSIVLHASGAGTVISPDTLLCDREDGGHLVVDPPRQVWERCELAPIELAHWSLLVAATGCAMLETLACLAHGCVNYWEAGNWALNDAAAPVGPKAARSHRRVHLHVLGRSPRSVRPQWAWGESPQFPSFAESKAAAAAFRPIADSELAAIAEHIERSLLSRFKLPPVAVTE